MRRALALAVMACALLLAGCATAHPSGPSIVGAWRLVKYVDTPEGGAAVEAFGAKPEGLFIFTSDGHASISMMRNPPGAANAIADPDPDACVPDWYCSYFGAYSVDWSRPAWTIRVEGGNIRSFIGTEQTREFALDGDTIRLEGSYPGESGRSVSYLRVLVRQR